jgi:hypothetical protein
VYHSSSHLKCGRYEGESLSKSSIISSSVVENKEGWVEERRKHSFCQATKKLTQIAIPEGSGMFMFTRNFLFRPT